MLKTISVICMIYLCSISVMAHADGVLPDEWKNFPVSVEKKITDLKKYSSKDLSTRISVIHSKKNKTFEDSVQMCALFRVLGQRGDLLKEKVDKMLGYNGLDYHSAISKTWHKSRSRDYFPIEYDEATIVYCYFPAAYQNELVVKRIETPKDVIVYSKARMRELWGKKMVVNPVSDFLTLDPDKYATAIMDNLEGSDDLAEIITLDVLSKSHDLTIPDRLIDFVKKKKVAERFRDRVYIILGEKGGKKSVSFLISELNVPGKKNKESLLYAISKLYENKHINKNNYELCLDYILNRPNSFDEDTRKEAQKEKDRLKIKKKSPPKKK